MNIDQTKRHIKNLIAGNNISKNDLLEMYKNIVFEQIKKRVDNLFKSYNIEHTVEAYVRLTISNYLNKILVEQNGHWSKAPKIEQLIMNECEKQIREIVRENFTITLNDNKVDIK